MTQNLLRIEWKRESKAEHSVMKYEIQPSRLIGISFSNKFPTSQLNDERKLKRIVDLYLRRTFKESNNPVIKLLGWKNSYATK